MVAWNNGMAWVLPAPNLCIIFHIFHEAGENMDFEAEVLHYKTNRYITSHYIIIQYLTVQYKQLQTYTDWDLETPQNFWRNQDYHQAAPYSSWRNFCSSLILSSPSFARSYTSHVVHHFFHQYKFHESSHVLMINISNLWTPNTGWKNRQYVIGAIMSLLARIGPFETWISWRMMHHLLPPTDLHQIWTLTGIFPWNKTIRKKYVELL